MKTLDDYFDETPEERTKRITTLAHRRLPPASNTPMADIPTHKREKVSVRRALRELILGAREIIREGKRLKRQARTERRHRASLTNPKTPA